MYNVMKCNLHGTSSTPTSICPMKEKSMQSQTYAVGWGTLALINAGLAQSKNKSGLLWFILSLFLGPVATFILVVFCKIPYAE